MIINPATKRKRQSRERLAKMGIKSVEVKLSENERNDLTRLCEIRGGTTGAYTVDEYISTLIRKDKERLEQQLYRTGPCCAACSDTFPSGPTGEIKIDEGNWHPIGRDDLAL